MFIALRRNGARRRPLQIALQRGGKLRFELRQLFVHLPCIDATAQVVIRHSELVVAVGTERLQLDVTGERCDGFVEPAVSDQY